MSPSPSDEPDSGSPTGTSVWLDRLDGASAAATAGVCAALALVILSGSSFAQALIRYEVRFEGYVGHIVLHSHFHPGDRTLSHLPAFDISFHLRREEGAPPEEENEIQIKISVLQEQISLSSKIAVQVEIEVSLSLQIEIQIS